MKRPLWKTILAATAIAFGILTVISGGSVLFGSTAIIAAPGKVVSFVLWFNFLSGFFYVLAGIGILLGKCWGKNLSILLAVSVSFVLAMFAWHVYSGGAYEMRTVGAMILRAGFWITAALLLRRQFHSTRKGN